MTIMPCPHSTKTDASPDRCSLCAGVMPRSVRITQIREKITIDDLELIDCETDLTVDGAHADRDVRPVRDTIERRRARRLRRQMT